MGLASDRAICLRKIEYSETSQILLLFTREHGLVRVIAKGAHRTTKQGASKFGGGIDLLDLANAVFTDRPEKELATLTEWKLLDGHLNLRRGLRGIYLAQYAAELVSLLIEEHDPHPTLFDRLEQMLSELAGGGIEQVFLSFQLAILRESGDLPEFGACVACGSAANGRDRAYFSSQRGGLLCANCQTKFPDRSSLDRRLIDLLQYLLKLTQATGQRLPILTRHQTDPLNRLLADHLQHTLARRLRVTRYVL